MEMRLFECKDCHETFAVSSEWNVVQCCPICTNDKQKRLVVGGISQVQLPARFNLVSNLVSDLTGGVVK